MTVRKVLLPDGNELIILRKPLTQEEAVKAYKKKLRKEYDKRIN